jgi:hypothetical protein
MHIYIANLYWWGAKEFYGTSIYIHRRRIPALNFSRVGLRLCCP